MLLAHLPEASSPRIMTVKQPDIHVPTPVRANGQKVKQVSMDYDPGLVFALEFATILCARGSETLSVIGKDVAIALMGVVRDSANMHAVTLSRTVYYLLKFLRASHVSALRFDHRLPELNKFSGP